MGGRGESLLCLSIRVEEDDWMIVVYQESDLRHRYTKSFRLLALQILSIFSRVLANAVVDK